MTPARLQALADVDDWAHEQAERNADKPARRRAVVQDPAAELAALAAL